MHERQADVMTFCDVNAELPADAVAFIAIPIRVVAERTGLGIRESIGLLMCRIDGITEAVAGTGHCRIQFAQAIAADRC